MQIFWPICLSLFSAWMVTLSLTVHLLISLRCCFEPSPSNRIASAQSICYYAGTLFTSLEKLNRIDGSSFPPHCDWDVVMRSPSHPPNDTDQVVKVFFVCDEVDVGGVDHQER